MPSIASGNPRKSSGLRKGHRADYPTTTLVPLASLSTVIPELPDAEGMLPATRESWVEFWRSPLAEKLLPGSDMRALVRMFHLSDELERCRVEFRQARLVTGSQGQPVLNPLGGHMLALAKEVRALEDRFGANILSRLRVSIELGEAQRSLEAMNARLSSNGEQVEVQIDDPREAAIDTTAS